MLTTPNTIDFKMPSNLMTGHVYTFRRLGYDIENGDPGDLDIHVVIARHPLFKCYRDRDITYEVEIPILDMLIGSELKIPIPYPEPS